MDGREELKRKARRIGNGREELKGNGRSNEGCKFRRGLVLKHLKTSFFILKVHLEICFFFFLPSF